MKNKFKKRIAIFSATISLFSFLTPLNVAKSDEIDTVTRHFSYAVAEDPSNPGQMNLYKVSAAGAATLIEANLFPDGGPGTFSASDMAVDNVLGKIYFREPPRGGSNPLRARVFDVKTETVTGWKELTGFASGAQPVFIGMPDMTSDKISKKCVSSNGTSCDSGTSKIITLGGSGSEEIAKIDDSSVSVGGSTLAKMNSDGSIQIGADGNDIDITAEGLSIDGNPMITKQADGNIHIGKNSLITPEDHSTLSDGTKVHHLWAEDENDNKIPINIYGSKLLIDGVEVTAGDSAQVTTNKNNISTNTSNISTNTSNISTNTSNISTNTSNIKKLGEGVAGSTALTAALTALPQTSKESKLSCGVGTGAYSSRYALGFGCASKINERVDINAGGSYVFGGSKSYGEGTLDSGVIKAGFVFKLGELNKPTSISIIEKEKMEDKIFSLEEKNEKIISQNEDLKNKNQSIIAQNKSLLGRLERLEKLALGNSKSQDLATIKLP